MRRLAIPLVLAWLVPAAASATILQAWDTGRLVAESTAVVQAKVLGQRVFSPDGKLILTETRLQVTRTLVGRCDSEVRVLQFGGRLGDRAASLPGDVAFPARGKVIVFLKAHDDAYLVAGMSQGLYVVDGAQAVRRVDAELATPSGLLPAGAGNRSLKVTLLVREIQIATRSKRP